MGVPLRVLGSWAVLLLALQVAGASHNHRSFDDEAAPPSVPASVVSPLHRTGYHFQPSKNWMNAPMYYKGWYHLFYQYNPKGAEWGNVVWAHSVSRDLINWVAIDPAIVPSIPSDQYGCWSGSATILPDGTPAIMYTGIDSHKNQVQNVAYPKNLSDPFLREWIKPGYNPVIAPGHGINASAFRDPSTAWYGPDGQWRLLVGSRVHDTGLNVLYRSRDFMRWVKAMHPLHSGFTGMWECPDFFPVAGRGLQNGLDTSSEFGFKYVLKNSLDSYRYDYYTVGRYDRSTDRYVPEDPNGDQHRLRYDYGNFYASKTFYDPAKRRRILWGWANESDTPLDDRAKGWAGIQAIPRTIWLSPSGDQLLQWPVDEVETLRRNHVSFPNRVVKAGDSFEVTGFSSVQSDVDVVFHLTDLDTAELFEPAWRRMDVQALCARRGADVKGGVGPFGLFVLASSDLGERTAVFFRVFKTHKNDSTHVVLMCNDATKSSFKPSSYRPTFAKFINVDIAVTNEISLRTLIDHSVIESFGAEGRACILSRVYPTRAVGNNARLFVFNNGESHVVTKLDAWEIKSPSMNAP